MPESSPSWRITPNITSPAQWCIHSLHTTTEMACPHGEERSDDATSDRTMPLGNWCHWYEVMSHGEPGSRRIG
jgi:hypothetical protein